MCTSVYDCNLNCFSVKLIPLKKKFYSQFCLNAFLMKLHGKKRAKKKVNK